MKIKMYLGALLASLLVGCATTNTGVKQLPEDPNWLTGKLESGFSYHILPVDEKSDRIQLYLRVNAGSVNETSEQQGYAHLLEHMAFNGTKNFPKHEIIRLFEKAGLGFGQDINAYTSFENTVYTLNIHEEDSELLPQVLRYYADVSSQISLDETEVAKEIGVVQGEIHNRANLYDEPHIAYMENFGEGTKYQYKNIGGTLQSVENATAAGLQTFYQTWYHPENIELIIVGNVNGEEIVKLINEQFSQVKGHGKLASKEPQTIPQFSQTAFSMTSSQVEIDNSSLVFNLPDYQYQTYQDDYQNRLTHLTNQLLNYRLSRSNELLEKPYNEAFSYIGTPNDAGNKWVYSLGVNHDVALTNSASEFLAVEVARLQQFGFTEAELTLQKSMLDAQIQTMKGDNHSNKSSHIINNSLKALIHQQVRVSPALDKQLATEFLANITLDEVNKFSAQTLVKPQFSAFYTWGSGTPNSDKIMAKVEQVFASQQTPPNANLVLPSTPLLTSLPAAGKIIKTTEYPKYQFQELQLDNGVTVLLQQDSRANGKVYLEFAAPGGITSLPANKRVAAVAAPNTYLFSGLSDLSGQQTEQLFKVNNTTLTPYINNTTQGFSVETTTNNVEFALTAIHAAMLNGKIDAHVFNNIKENMRNWNRNNDPGFQSIIQKDLFLNNPYEGKLSLTQLHKLDIESVEWVYKTLFGHANGFKLTLIGDFEQAQAKLLIEKYLGSLPKGQLHQYATKKQPFSTKKVKLQEYVNSAQRADLVFDFIFEATQPSIKEIYAADIMSRILNRKMYAYVREELSLSYAPNAWCGFSTPGSNYARCQINVVTDKQDAYKGVDAVEQALAEIYQQGVSQEELDEHKYALALAMSDNDKLPKARAWFVHRDFMNNFPVGAVLEPNDIVASIDKSYIDALINHSLKEAGQVTLTVLPK